MPIQLDHFIVPARDQITSAKCLSYLLGIPWAEEAQVGPFSPVYINEGLTLDFVNAKAPLPRHHYCFRVSDDDFDPILERIKLAGIAYRANVHGEVDRQINTKNGGKGVYWNEPDGHQWEMLTVSYARAAA
jgi:hypothetical protein